MKRLLVAAAFALLTTGALACDASSETAFVVSYDKFCAKLPADFVKHKIRNLRGISNVEAMEFQQQEYDRDPAAYCSNERATIKMILDDYRKNPKGQC